MSAEYTAEKCRELELEYADDNGSAELPSSGRWHPVHIKDVKSILKFDPVDIFMFQRVKDSASAIKARLKARLPAEDTSLQSPLAVFDML